MYSTIHCSIAARNSAIVPPSGVPIAERIEALLCERSPTPSRVGEPPAPAYEAGAPIDRFGLAQTTDLFGEPLGPKRRRRR